jgi:asparagine synthase (glutamine-hydrolysing)
MNQDSREPTLARSDEDLDEVLRLVREQRLTYLRPPALRQLARAVRTTERAGLEGILVEAGTALGGSAVVMASAKAVQRRLLLFDAFGMIPAPSDDDGDDVKQRYRRISDGQATGIGGDLYYGYRHDLLSDVVAAFDSFDLPLDRHNIELIPGLFEQTLVIPGPIAFAHLDGDWYASTMTCLERIIPHLVLGGRVIVDDYHAWSGCRKAVDEYFRTDRGCTFESHARLHIVRVEAADPEESSQNA